MFSTRESPTSPAGATVFSEEEEDKTRALSVATLRDLVARSADDESPTAPTAGWGSLPTDAPARPPVSRSRPMFLEKSGAVLVLPETPAPPPETPLPQPPPEAAVAGGPISEVHALSPGEPEPVVPSAAVIERRVVKRQASRECAGASKVVANRPPRSARRAGLPRAPYTAWEFIRCRLIAIGLLALVVASQPWWWDIGNVRAAPHPVAAGGVAPGIHR